MRYEVKAVSLWSFIKVSFFIHSLFGLLFGLLSAVFFSFSMALSDGYGAFGFDDAGSSDSEAFLGFLFLSFFFGVGYVMFGTFCSFVFAGLYNLLAKIVGGLELNLEPIPEKTDSLFIKKKDAVTTYLAQTPTPQFSPPAASVVIPKPEIRKTDEEVKGSSSDSVNTDNNGTNKTVEDHREGDQPQP